MTKSFIPRRREKTGLPPGSLVFTGDRKVEHIQMHTIVYDGDSIQEDDIVQIQDFQPDPSSDKVCWLNINGLHDVRTIEFIGKRFQIPDLVLEDILHTEQRSKSEDLEDLLFLVLKMVTFIPETAMLQWEQISLIVRDHYVFSFQEFPRDVFDAVRERIRQNRGRIRKSGADYLVYALVDAIVDNYFNALEVIGERIETLEERVVEDPAPDISQEIYQLKREMIFLRRSVWPLREVIGNLERLESHLFQPETLPFLRDLYDHTVQVMETIETYRDVLNGLRDTYLSSISNRMNVIMKVLTIIATIFIPLTFVAGIYGMNFEWMPELKWKWAYPCVWLLMGLIAAVMIVFFRKKKWI